MDYSSFPAKDADRFWSKVDRGPGCWLWTSDLNNQGYGRFAVYKNDTRTRYLAHRLSYWLTYGELDEGSVLRHSCDTPRCCRPGHLTPGTQVDNMADARQRGRLNVDGLMAQNDRKNAEIAARIEAGEKTCKICRETKPFTEFHRHRLLPDGRNIYCRPCVRAHETTRKMRAAGISVTVQELIGAA